MALRRIRELVEEPPDELGALIYRDPIPVRRIGTGFRLAFLLSKDADSWRGRLRRSSSLGGPHGAVHEAGACRPRPESGAVPERLV